MDDEGTSSSRVSKKSKKMENTPKPNNGSKVKLKVVKKKVNIRRPNGLNRSNTSFNTSLNASMRMKQSLTNNNRALAQALQITKQDLALATDLIASLKKENKDLMMEKAEISHFVSQGIDVQVNEKLKPVLVTFKTKIREVSNRLGDVASAMKDLSSCVSSQFSAISRSNSRINSLETYQELPTSESTATPPSDESPKRRSNESPKRRRSSFCPPALQNNGSAFNDLSLIAESSFLNLDLAQNGIDVMDMVLENETEKCKEMSDVKLIEAAKPPQRVPVEGRRSRSRRDSKSRRQSMDEIDFGPNVVKSRKSRRSSFFLSTAGLEKAVCPTAETALEDDATGSNNEVQINDVQDNKVQDDVQDNKVQDNDSEMVETEQLVSPTLLEDDDTSLKTEPPVIDSTMENEMYVDLQPDAIQSNSSTEQLQDPAPVMVDISLVTPKTLPPTQTDQIDHTVINEEDMELTEVIDSSLQLNVEISSLPEVQSTQITEGPEVPSTQITEEPEVQSTKKPKGSCVQSTKKSKEQVVQSAKEMEKPDPVDSKENNQNEDAAFVKPLRAPKKKTESKKDEKKQTKNTKEKLKEPPTEDESKAVVELRLPKPGKIIFSAVRKNIAGVRPSPPKARSKKKLAEIKKDELAAEPKNLFDFHDKTPQLLAKKPEAIETGIYDVSLNDSVYGTCQSLGEYRERVAMAKRTTSVLPGEARRQTSSSLTDAALTEVDGGNEEPAVEAVPDASTKSTEEKKKRVRSRKVATDDKEEKKKRTRSKKRAATGSDSDSEDEGERTYVKHYQQTVKSSSTDAAPEREFTRRARSRVINYKEEESDFDMTLIEKKTPVIPSKKTEEKQKEKEADVKDSSSETKDEKPKRKSAPNGQDPEFKNDHKKERERKSMKETSEKRARSRKKSVAAAKNVDDHSEGGVENSVPEKSDLVSKSSTQSGLQSLISQMEKLQKKCSRSQQQSEKETQDPVESTSKSKSSCTDMFERYKKALAMSSDTDCKSDLKKRQNSKSRSRPARNESSDEKSSKNDRGRSRSLHARKIPDKMDDPEKSMPEKNRSESANEKEPESNESSSPVEKQEESPEARKKKTERGRSKSRARSSARSKSNVLEARSTSPEKKREESPETLQRKIRKDRGRSRSKAAVAKDDDPVVTDKKVLTSDHSNEVEPEVDSDYKKVIRSRSVARRELLAKLKSSNADKENKASTDTNGQNLNMDAARKSESNVTTEEVKSLNGHSKQTSESLKTISTNVPVRTLSISPRRSSEKNPGKRLSELNTDENQDLKRPRRATKPMSYKEPSIMTKLRQGDKLFGDVPVKRISSGQGNFSTMFDEEPRKRSILENVTNVNC